MALPAAMFSLVAMAVLVSGMYAFTDLGAKSVRNRESAVRAAHVAEAGVNHTVGLMRGSLRSQNFSRILIGSDNIAGTADDSVLTGWGLAAEDQIPLAGQAYQGHTYFVAVRDDAADGDVNAATDLNGRVQVRCRAVTADGATAEVEAIIGAVPMPAVTVDGNLTFMGVSNQIAGACGGAHANGNVTSGGAGPTIGTQISATGGVGGNYRLPNGSPAPTLNGMDEIVVPDLNPMNFCGGAEFRLLAGGAVTDGAGNPVGTPPGWNYIAGTQTWSANNPTVPGTYCVQGNATLGGNSTGSALNPLALSILATGSISAAGTSVIRPDHPDGILFMAAGDVVVAGNGTPGTDSYAGMVYAGAQCRGAGSATMFGQLVCANGPQPLGSTDHIPGNELAGSFVINFDCAANVFNKRRILFWYPRIGT
jgi:hypothetical protein